MKPPAQYPGQLPKGASLDSLLTVGQFAVWQQRAESTVRAELPVTPGVIARSRENVRIHPRTFLAVSLKGAVLACLFLICLPMLAGESLTSARGGVSNRHSCAEACTTSRQASFPPAGEVSRSNVAIREVSFGQIADAIRRAEGVWTYGVNVPVRDEAEARRVCLNTIAHARRDWDGRGCFIEFLADRYCPPSADLSGNRNWRRNVRLIFENQTKRKNQHENCIKSR